MPRFVVGVMGSGDASSRLEAAAEVLGELIAHRGWVLLTGGRNAGVMGAAGRGAKKVSGSIVVGVLPTEKTTPAPSVDIAIVTNMHDARNAINVLSSNVIVACGGGSGTASEVALALKAGKTVLLLEATDAAYAFFRELAPDRVVRVASPEEAVVAISGIAQQFGS